MVLGLATVATSLTMAQSPVDVDGTDAEAGPIDAPVLTPSNDFEAGPITGRLTERLDVAQRPTPQRAGTRSESARGRWMHDVDRAAAEAERLDLPLLVHFHASWCGPCRRMDRETLGKPALLSQLGTRFIGVKVDADRNEPLVDKLKVRSLPCDLVITPDGKILSRNNGYQSGPTYLSKLAQIESEYAHARKMRIVRSQRNNMRPPSDDRLSPTSPHAAQNRARDHEDGRAGTGSAASQSSRFARPGEERGDPTDRDAGVEIIGLDGYSPVTLYRFRKWEQGNERFKIEHKGIVYHLASAVERRAFANDPDRFAPQLLGCDPVLLQETKRALFGSTKHAAYCDGELYLFSSQRTRQQFKADPDRYLLPRSALGRDKYDDEVVR